MDDRGSENSQDTTSSGGEISPDPTPRYALPSSQPQEINKDAVILETETASEVDDAGARQKSSEGREPPRLLIVSNRVRSGHVMQASLLPNVKLVLFKHDQCDLDGVLSSVATAVGSSKFESIALILPSTGTTLSLCGVDEKIITKEKIIEMSSVREFFSTLVNNHIDKAWVNARIDFLKCALATSVDGEIIANEIGQMTKLPCCMIRDFVGVGTVIDRISEEQKGRTIGSLYFKTDNMRPTSSKQSMALFEKIRTVGKGAYGSAVLYRKRDDDSLVILKEVNMHDLNALERQMALNEVKVLSMLDHPNVVSYFDSFEEDGILMIEMEYADGGTLAQFLGSRDHSIEEKKILEMFTQMVAAMRHIHGHNILHRDLKTANIFLTKDGVVKLGDFGISKMLTTGGRNANTVVGTPYYISPEMCEGKPYGPKSDIWSLGCILYEMACLERTFEASNLPAVVTKIVKGVYTPVRGNYSQEFKALVEKMLDRDPNVRPSADQLWTELLPPLTARYEANAISDADEDLNSSADSRNKKKMRSELYYLSTHNLNLSNVSLPQKIKVKDIFVGMEHTAIISQESVVLTYGRGTEGQLGHGDDKSLSEPTVVEGLKGKSINKAACGEGFSVFGSSNGIVITCGDGQSGCLGHGDYQSVYKPKLIEALLHVDVVSLDCGPQHVAVVSSSGEVYTWGNGSSGKLGLGSEESYLLPQRVAFSEAVKITEVYCGNTGTMFITDVGSVWACGSNKHNKLGLNNRQGFIAQLKNAFNKTEVEGSKVPVLVRDLCRYRVISISMGTNHTAVLTEGGKVITFGRNAEGQLGNGDVRPQPGLINVRPLEPVQTVKVSCTSLITIVSLSSGQLLFWGSRQKTRLNPDLYKWLDPALAKRLKSADLKRQSSAGSSRSLSKSSLHEHMQGVLIRSNSRNVSDGAMSLEPDLRTRSDSDLSLNVLPSMERISSVEAPTSTDDLELQLEPAPLINLESDEETVVLSTFQNHGENVLILVETTAPPVQKKTKKRALLQRTTESYSNLKHSASSREACDEMSNSEASEIDTLGTTPSWIKQELDEAEQIILPSFDTDEESQQKTNPNADQGMKVRASTEAFTDPSSSQIKPTRPSGKATVFTGNKRLSSGSTDESSANEEEDVDEESRIQVESQPSQRPVITRRSQTPAPPIRSQGTPSTSKVVRAVEPQERRSQSGAVSRQSAANHVTAGGGENLQQEILKIREESNLRISQLEDQYKRKVDQVKEEADKQVAEREKQLKEEMRQLREEMSAQIKQMKENSNMVANLQEQLVNLKTKGDGDRNNNNGNQGSFESKQPANNKSAKQQAKSSICLLQ